MAFEAFHTAKKRQAGMPVDEWSSLDLHPTAYMLARAYRPSVADCLGVLFLLDTLHMIAFRELARFWPVLLIVAGGIMLYNRVAGGRSAPQVLDQTLNRGAHGVAP